MDPLHVSADNAPKFIDWLANRGGLLVWTSSDLSNPGRSVTTPALSATGSPTQPPGWQFVDAPRHITSIDDVLVYVPKTLDSFEVKLVRNCCKLELSKSSSRKLRTRLAKHANSWFVFRSTGTSQGDPVHGMMFGSDTVDILVDDTTTPLSKWKDQNK